VQDDFAFILLGSLPPRMGSDKGEVSHSLFYLAAKLSTVATGIMEYIDNVHITGNK
jgi:hypothetical protein